MTLRELLKVNSVVFFLYYLPIKVFLTIARFFPLQRKIVFDNFCGRGLGDDPKYILLQMIKDGINAKYIWLTNDLSIEVPAEVTKVQFGSWRAKYHYLTAKIWVDNVKNVSKPKKRKGQFYLQTWHSIFTTKMLEQDVESTLSPNYVTASKEDSSKIDLMYANNDFNVNLFKRSFWYNGKVIKADAPHLTHILEPPHKLKEEICSKYNIPKEKHIILYTPTFRKKFDISVFKWDYALILESFKRKYKKEFIFLAKFHPNVSRLMSSFSDKVLYNLSDYPDVTELVAISDILVTDLSSVAYEMAIKRQPVFLFMKDLEDYMKNDRTQYFPIDSLPFPVAQTEDEFVKKIDQFNEFDYKKKVNAFFEKIGLNESGKGSMVISNILKGRLQ